jgi:hypothetical protein
MHRLVPLLAAAAIWLPPPPALALPLISEACYDAAGSDDGLSFVELYGAPGSDLAGYTLEGVNGADGAVGPSLALVGLIPADGLFVVADLLTGGGTLVPGADLVLNFDLQNGPDSIVLRLGALIVDALAYGAFGPGDVGAGEGAPALDPAAGSSVARRFANVDSGDNAADFEALAVPTPGSAPLAVSAPEPAAVGLALAGLGSLGLGVAPRAPRRRR